MTEANEQVAALNASEDKSVHEVHTGMGSHHKWLPSGIISFDDFDAMEEAKRQALAVKNDASLFSAMIDNILELETEENKSQMMVTLARQFIDRVQQPVEEKETDDHYKEVWNDAIKATDDDFQGGCPTCQFGEVDKLKQFSKCPYCQNELELV